MALQQACTARPVGRLLASLLSLSELNVATQTAPAAASSASDVSGWKGLAENTTPLGGGAATGAIEPSPTTRPSSAQLHRSIQAVTVSPPHALRMPDQALSAVAGWKVTAVMTAPATFATSLPYNGVPQAWAHQHLPLPLQLSRSQPQSASPPWASLCFSRSLSQTAQRHSRIGAAAAAAAAGAPPAAAAAAAASSTPVIKPDGSDAPDAPPPTQRDDTSSLQQRNPHQKPQRSGSPKSGTGGASSPQAAAAAAAAASAAAKEVHLKPRISEHDLATKLRRVEGWLAGGARVQVVVDFKGQEQSEAACTLVDVVVTRLAGKGRADGAKRQHKTTWMINLRPTAPPKQPKPPREQQPEVAAAAAGKVEQEEGDKQAQQQQQAGAQAEA